MITKKDQDIINFLEEFHIATSSQICRLFYNGNKRYCKHRLKKMTDEDILKRAKSTIDNCYAYYLEKKPIQIHHDLIRTELYVNLKLKFNLLEWHNEVAIDNIRSDALCYIENKGIVYPVLVEIHLSNKFDFDKYKIDLTPYFGMKPKLIICTDRNIYVADRKFILIGTDMSGLEWAFR